MAEVDSISYIMRYGIYTTTCDTGARSSLRSIPPVRSIYWCHRSSVVTVSQRTTHANTSNVRGSIALLLLDVYHGVQTN